MSKVIAIIDKPENCEKCTFGACIYSTPLSTHRKGYFCRLKNKVKVEDFDYDEEVHLSNCPLKPLPEYDSPAINPTVGNTYYAQGWNDCIDEILKGGGVNE